VCECCSQLFSCLPSCFSRTFQSLGIWPLSVSMLCLSFLVLFVFFSCSVLVLFLFSSCVVLVVFCLVSVLLCSYLFLLFLFCSFCVVFVLFFLFSRFFLFSFLKCLFLPCPNRFCVLVFVSSSFSQGAWRRALSCYRACPPRRLRWRSPWRCGTIHTHAINTAHTTPYTPFHT
jgi:hypothetical protein